MANAMTVRLPDHVHKYLELEAADSGLSINAVTVAMLEQACALGWKVRPQGARVVTSDAG